MKRILFIKLFLFYSLSLLYGQSSIKVMTYNLLKFPDGATGIDRKVDLRYILQEYQPDIFSVCELQSEDGSDTIINYCLQTQDNRYSAANFDYNHSGYYQDLNNMLYYNRRKLELVSQTYIRTDLRDINRYTLKLLTQDADNNPVYIEVYVAHLKASQGTDNENKRLYMVEDFVTDLSNIPQDHYVIFTGDFNMYSSNEPAYQKIINTSNSIILKDPLGSAGLGSWSNNTNFSLYHTQATHTLSDNDFVGGGLDDRFDFIFLSENYFNAGPLKFVNGSYKVFGNNGNCFNKRVNDNSCSGEFSLETRNHLYNMSDHLPITLQLESETTLNLAEVGDRINIFINEGVPVIGNISFNGEIEPNTDLVIFDLSGKMILKKENYIKNSIISLTHIKPGIYFARFNNNNFTKIIRFIKA